MTILPAFQPGAAASSAAGSPSVAARLTTAQRAALASLSATDRKVRAHEQAHLMAAGPYASGGPSYTYAKGPNGNLYAVGGEVGLNVSPDPSDPQKTLNKARIVEMAANAPADPSAQDRAVAGMAAEMAQAAQQQLDAQHKPGAQRQPAGSAYSPQAPMDQGSLLSLIA